MITDLPPLPASFTMLSEYRAPKPFDVQIAAYTANQMRAYARAALEKSDAKMQFAGWFTEQPSAMSYRVWEQGGHDPKPEDVALFESANDTNQGTKP